MDGKETPSFEALLPPAMAKKAVDSGVKKANTNGMNLMVLGILAGAFVAIGAIFATATTSGMGNMPFGLTKLIMGLAFSVGLILVIVGGAELFTGNNLIVLAFAAGKVSLVSLLRNWLIVYLANFIGSAATALLVFAGKHYMAGHGAVGLNMLNIGEAKTSLEFFQAVALGILCNGIVCMAVWLTYSARTTTDKILAIIPTVAAFVAAGFEHSVANMYFIPVALLVKYGASPAFFSAVQKTPADFPHLTWANFLVVNLLPVTIGNIIGGALMVGLVYWFIYLRSPQPAAQVVEPEQD